MRFLTLTLLVSVFTCSAMPAHANHFDCPDNCYKYYGEGSSYDCCGEACVAGRAYTQATICNMRTGLLVGGPIVAGIIAILIWTSNSHSHS